MARRSLLSLVLVLIASSVPIRGECIAPPPPCEALADATVVFVGDATATSSFTWTSGGTGQRVHLRVVERFKGVERRQREVVARVALTAETVSFTPGVRYLIYARQIQSDGLWSTSCSRTKPVAQAAGEVSQLRRCTRR